MMQREWSELGFRFCGAEPGRITLLLFKFLLSTKIKSIKLKMNLTRTVTVTINLCNSSGRWHQRQRGSTFVRILRRAIWWATANQNHPTVRGVSQFDPGDIFLHNKVAGVIITPVSDCSRPLLCKLIDAFRRHFVCSNNSWIFISLIKHLRNVQGCKLLMKWGRFTWNTLLKFVFVSFVSTFSSWRFSFCRYLLKLLSHNCSCWCDHSYYETHFYCLCWGDGHVVVVWEGKKRLFKLTEISCVSGKMAQFKRDQKLTTWKTFIFEMRSDGVQ